MALVAKTLFGTIDKVARSIERIKHFEPPEGYYLAFSGGKDSIVLHRLAEMAGVKFEAHYSYSGLDPIDVVKFIKKEYPCVAFEYPRKSYGKIFIEKCLAPTSRIRWCCSLLKENAGAGRHVLLGLRKEESRSRANRQVASPCDKGKWLVSPILDWTTSDIWGFIKGNNITYPLLYDSGWERIGCIGCPMATRQKREWEFKQYPKVKNMIMTLFRRAFKHNPRYVDAYKTPEAWFEWWMERSPKKEIEGQCYLFDN